MASINNRETLVQVAGDRAAVVEGVRGWLAQAAQKATAAGRPFHVAVSGGGQPALLAEVVASGGDTLALDDWQVWLVDERVVTTESEHSTAAGLADLLAALPPGAGHMLDPTVVRAAISADYAPETLAAVAASYAAAIEAALPATDGVPVFDAILLGLGPDGHTASLFPDSTLLADPAPPIVQYTDCSPKPPPQRVTLSLPVINAAAAVCFIATGASKADVLPTLVGTSKLPPSPALPASLVAPPAGLTWFVDEPAAARLV
ncbi:6-phosphogluconolactonase [Thecamonas trahens ATCC 50062]|uniref:6-phosphogluconolactonase n=1 Tax=Thecamonas trahens ATCC 50062 TaxID=461836 RepID=A0A0L0D153_THETB|nr:6-phosphogluconolactonase [Thecamonas trahens ATCC 50062]KNC46084.1 6-phosphogluconolactonase [Thecamonas trahens ATCC 50062]|eukprot:XP_013763064.1 6-phosphogluconolactonase [Thecamonas trahens ATCC 50062]